MGEKRKIYVAYNWFASTRGGMGSAILDITCPDGQPRDIWFRRDQVEDLQKQVLKDVQTDTTDATSVVLINWIWLDPSPPPGGSHA